MILRDWREADPGLLRSCYDTEEQHWHRELAWDTAWTWATVEQARLRRALPGLLAFDEAGRLHGWAFYVLEGATLHLGGLVAESDATTAALLDGILDAADGGDIERAACFILERAPGLAPALAMRGFDVERFLYLSRPLGPALPRRGPPGAPGTPSEGPQPRIDTDTLWRESDRSQAAVLLQAAYPGAAGEYFAPNGTPEEWVTYVAGLVEQAGCGTLDRVATRVARDGDGLRALALMTQVAPATAHLAQMAVRPDCRGRGLASQLMRDAAAGAANDGKGELTLLVGETNDVARGMYAAMGFVRRAQFIAAKRRLRSPSLA